MHYLVGSATIYTIGGLQVYIIICRKKSFPEFLVDNQEAVTNLKVIIIIIMLVLSYVTTAQQLRILGDYLPADGGANDFLDCSLVDR